MTTKIELDSNGRIVVPKLIQSEIVKFENVNQEDLE